MACIGVAAHHEPITPTAANPCMTEKIHDAVGYILGSWPGEKIPDPPIFHELIYPHIKGNALFNGIYFDTNGPRPFSESLEEEIGIYRSSGMIEINLMRGYLLSPGIKERLVRRCGSDLSKGEKEYLANTAKAMYNAWTPKTKK